MARPRPGRASGRPPAAARRGRARCTAGGVRLQRAAHREQRQGRDHYRGPGQPRQVVAGQRGLAEGGRVAAHEAERLGRAQREPRRRSGAGAPGPLADQAQPGRGERGQVPGADRPVQRHRRGEAPVDRVRQHVEHRRVHPGAARADLVQPDHQHGPAQIRRRAGARPGRVAAQQPQPVLGQLIAAASPTLRLAPTPVVRPYTGRGRGHLPGGLPRGPGRRDRAAGATVTRASSRATAATPAQRQRRPVDHDARLRHPLPSLPSNASQSPALKGPLPRSRGPPVHDWDSRTHRTTSKPRPRSRDRAGAARGRGQGMGPGLPESVAEPGDHGISRDQDRYDDRLMEVAPCLPSSPAAAVPARVTGPPPGMAGRSRSARRSP